MPQSLARIIVHLTFSTKGRRRLILPEVRGDLEGFLVGISRTVDSPTMSVKAVADHVHLLFTLSRTHSLSDVVEEFKRGSSKWMKTKGREYADFYWQNGYGAFSIGQSMVDDVRKYIASQDEHHRAVTFEEEFRTFLERYGVEFDERYVWD